MSGLARMLLDAGAIVTGSEPKPNAQTFDLTQRGVNDLARPARRTALAEMDLVVRTAAVPDSNPEFKAALRYGSRRSNMPSCSGR